MSEYIKKESVIKSITDGVKTDADAKAVAEMLLADVSDADVIDLVRCKDCKYREHLPSVCYGECLYMVSMVADNDYCSNGEKK